MDNLTRAVRRVLYSRLKMREERARMHPHHEVQQVYARAQYAPLGFRQKRSGFYVVSVYQERIEIAWEEAAFQWLE